MGDFKGLTDKLKIKDNKYVMEAGKIKIGKGMISCDENILIPLSAVSLVEIPEQEKSSQGLCELRIQNHAGTYFTITAPDSDFIREIRSALLLCMNDGSAVYSGTERAVVSGEHRIYGDKIRAAGDIHIEGTRHVRAAVPAEKNNGSVDKTTILDDEWKLLEEYSLQRMQDFAANERNHTVCAAMAAAAELKNREKCKRILAVSGNNALDMIVAGAPIAVKAVVNKLM